MGLVRESVLKLVKPFAVWLMLTLTPGPSFSALPAVRSAHSPLLLLGGTASRSYLQFSWADGAGKSLQGVGLRLNSLPGCGQTGSKVGRTPWPRIQIRQICTQPRSMLRVWSCFGSADDQSHWLGLLFGHCRYELSQRRSICWLLQDPPPSSLQADSQSLSPADSPCGTRSE